MRAGDEERRPVPGRVNGGNHRNVDVAGPLVQELGGLFFAAGRNRIDVEIVRIALQVRGNGTRSVHARCGCDGRYDKVRLAHGVGG